MHSGSQARSYSLQRCGAQYLHHSRSPFGPWLPVVPQGCTESTGVWPHGGGNNPSPYIVDAEAGALTGLSANTVVIITTCNQGNRTSPSADPALSAYMCVGLAQTWRHPVILNTTIMWRLPDQNAYANISVVTRMALWTSGAAAMRRARALACSGPGPRDRPNSARIRRTSTWRGTTARPLLPPRPAAPHHPGRHRRLARPQRRHSSWGGAGRPT